MPRASNASCGTMTRNSRSSSRCQHACAALPCAAVTRGALLSSRCGVLLAHKETAGFTPCCCVHAYVVSMHNARWPLQDALAALLCSAAVFRAGAKLLLLPHAIIAHLDVQLVVQAEHCLEERVLLAHNALSACAVPRPLVVPEGLIIAGPAGPHFLQLRQQVLNFIHVQLAGGVTELRPGAITALWPQAMHCKGIPAGSTCEGG